LKLIKKSVLLFAVILSIAMLTSCVNNQIGLGFNVKKGEKYRVKQVSEQKTTQNMGGQKMETKQTTETVYIYEVTDIDSGGIASIKVIFDSISVRTEGSMGSFQYDSNKDKGNGSPLTAVYDGMIGQGFAFRIDKSGKVVSIEGMDRLMNELIDKMDIQDPALKETMVQTFKQSFGEDILKSALSQTTDVYPEGKIKVGDSWEDKQVISAGFPMEINSIYTLKEDKGGRLQWMWFLSLMLIIQQSLWR
jgi:hypothetical protein